MTLCRPINCPQNTLESGSRMSSGNEFQTVWPATEKAPQPYWKCGIISDIRFRRKFRPKFIPRPIRFECARIDCPTRRRRTTTTKVAIWSQFLIIKQNLRAAIRASLMLPQCPDLLSPFSVKACPHCRRKVRQSPNFAVVSIATVWTGLYLLYCLLWPNE